MHHIKYHPIQTEDFLEIQSQNAKWFVKIWISGQNHFAFLKKIECFCLNDDDVMHISTKTPFYMYKECFS